MTANNPIQLIGAPPSPYTRKMVSLLRYRRIPYQCDLGPSGRGAAGNGFRKA